MLSLTTCAAKCTELETEAAKLTWLDTGWMPRASNNVDTLAFYSTNLADQIIVAWAEDLNKTGSPGWYGLVNNSQIDEVDLTTILLTATNTVKTTAETKRDAHIAEIAKVTAV